MILHYTWSELLPDVFLAKLRWFWSGSKLQHPPIYIFRRRKKTQSAMNPYDIYMSILIFSLINLYDLLLILISGQVYSKSSIGLLQLTAVAHHCQVSSMFWSRDCMTSIHFFFQFLDISKRIEGDMCIWSVSYSILQNPSLICECKQISPHLKCVFIHYTQNIIM